MKYCTKESNLGCCLICSTLVCIDLIEEVVVSCLVNNCKSDFSAAPGKVTPFGPIPKCLAIFVKIATWPPWLQLTPTNNTINTYLKITMKVNT